MAAKKKSGKKRPLPPFMQEKVDAAKKAKKGAKKAK